MVNEPIDISSDTSLSLPETLSLPLTASATGQTTTTTFLKEFLNPLDDRYRELQDTSIPLRLDWNTFVAPLRIFGQHLDSQRQNNRALNRLQYRQNNHKDIENIIFPS